MNYIDMPSKLYNKKSGIAKPVKGTEAVKNSIHNIIATPIGSIPGHPEFGSRVNKYIFELIDPAIKEMIKAEISYSLKRWEPRVDIISIEVNDDPDYNRVTIKMIYNIITDLQSNEHEYIYSQQV